MKINRPDFINLIAKDTGVSLHQAENILNAIFAYLKTLLSEETVKAIANDIEAEDLKGVWLTSKLATKESDIPKSLSEKSRRSPANSGRKRKFGEQIV